MSAQKWKSSARLKKEEAIYSTRRAGMTDSCRERFIPFTFHVIPCHILQQCDGRKNSTLYKSRASRKSGSRGPSPHAAIRRLLP